MSTADYDLTDELTATGQETNENNGGNSGPGVVIPLDRILARYRKREKEREREREREREGEGSEREKLVYSY